MFRHSIPALALCALLVAACSSGGGTPSVPPPPSNNVPVGPTQQTVTLQAGGYTLSFVVPPVSVGSTATMTATLSTTKPPGVTLPQSWNRKPNNIGVPLNALVYLTVTTSADVGFSSAPAFTFTVPSGAIPSGQQTYLLWFDTYQSTAGWVNLLGPGTVTSQTDAFPSRSYGFTLHPNAQYVYALAVTQSPAPTATPAPTPTPVVTPSSAPPTASPTPGASPAACAAPPANTFPMAIKDNSGITTPLRIYVWGNRVSDGALVDLTDPTSGTLSPIPASGQPIPSFSPGPGGCVNLPLLNSARIYFYYMTVSSPVAGLYSNGNGVAVPSAWDGSANAQNAWDVLEYSWPAASSGMNFDYTQVDDLSLPMEFWLANGTTQASGHQTYGFLPGAFTSAVSQLNAQGHPWDFLTQNTQTPTSSGSTWQRILAPQHAEVLNLFPSSYMLESGGPVDQVWKAYTGSNGLTLSYGGVTGTGVVDGSNTMNFTPSGGGSVYSIAQPTDAADIFGIQNQFSPSGLFGQEMGRSLAVSLLRGTLPVPSPLPPGWPSAPQPICDSHFFYHGYLNGQVPPKGTEMSWYGAVLHQVAINQLAYAISDDDTCNVFAPDDTSTYSPGLQWDVTINRQ